MRERKRIARLLLTDVTVTRTSDTITAHVRLAGGQARALTLPVPEPAWKIRQAKPWSTPGLVETRFSPDALVWVAVVFHGTAAWRNHGLIIFRFCFIEHLSSCAVQLSRLMAGCARRAAPGGRGISSSGTRFALRVPRAGQG
jgi:hypothetical protein